MSHTRNDLRHPNGVFEWVSRRIRPIAAVSVVLAVLLGAAGFGIRLADKLENGPDDPAFDPGGEIYDTADRVDDLFDPATEVLTSVFFVESPDPRTATSSLETRCWSS